MPLNPTIEHRSATSTQFTLLLNVVDVGVRDRLAERIKVWFDL